MPGMVGPARNGSDYFVGCIGAFDRNHPPKQVALIIDLIFHHRMQTTPLEPAALLNRFFRNTRGAWCLVFLFPASPTDDLDCAELIFQYQRINSAAKEGIDIIWFTDDILEDRDGAIGVRELYFASGASAWLEDPNVQMLGLTSDACRSRRAAEALAQSHARRCTEFASAFGLTPSTLPALVIYFRSCGLPLRVRLNSIPNFEKFLEVLQTLDRVPAASSRRLGLFPHYDPKAALHRAETKSERVDRLKSDAIRALAALGPREGWHPSLVQRLEAAISAETADEEFFAEHLPDYDARRVNLDPLLRRVINASKRVAQISRDIRLFEAEKISEILDHESRYLDVRAHILKHIEKIAVIEDEVERSKAEGLAALNKFVQVAEWVNKLRALVTGV